MDGKAFPVDIIYAGGSDFNFGRKVLDGLQRAVSSPQSTNESPKADRPEDDASDSTITPLTSEDEDETLPTASLAAPPVPCPANPTPSLPIPRPVPNSNPVPSSSGLPAESTPPIEPLSRTAKRKAQKKAASRRNAKRKKIANQAYHPDERLAKKHTKESINVTTAFNAQNFGISSKGYIGNRAALKKGSKKSTAYDLDLLVGPNSKYNFSLVIWNGSGDRPISDASGLVIGAGIGAPRGDESWQETHRRAAEAIFKARADLVFDPKEKSHRRGKFPAVNVGISHGGGQPYPKILEHSAHNERILDGLLEEEAFIRISGFTTGAFASWAPRLYEYENNYLNDLIAHDKELRANNQHPRPQDKPLRRNFPNTAWAATAYNFGPQTVCYKHIDFGNLAFGWCVITALGNYDYTKGGHLVLWDLKLVIQFPPGASIMIPSCAIAHSNTRIQPGETRYSFTQYTSGGIFRWVDNGYKTVEAYLGDLNADERTKVLEQLAHQLEHGLSLYSTLDELRGRNGSL